jgi:predicted CopG family antitoxin
MATKTISLAEDAYDRLKALKHEGESFSDVVRRLTAGTDLREFHGVLSNETAAELETAIADRRANRAGRRDDRRERLQASLDDS